MSQPSLTLPASGPESGTAAGRRRRLLELAGAAAIAGTYVFLVLTQPADIANGPASFSALVDSDLEPLAPAANLHEVSRYFATYNLVNAPVIDGEHRLIGAVTVDDVLDHVLPEDWRGTQLDSQSALTPSTLSGVGRGQG